MRTSKGSAADIIGSRTFLLRRDRLELGRSARCGRDLVMGVSAAPERHPIKNVFLKPFQPQIDDRSNEQGDELRKNQTADDHQPEWPARRTIRPETDGHWDGAH